MEKRIKLCPRCKENYLDPEEAMNALSRADNETYICSDCGTAEAMEDYFHQPRQLSWLIDLKLEQMDE